MATTLKTGDELRCPHCGELQEGPVEDFTIPGRIGVASSGAPEQCWNCDKFFQVTYLGHGRYEVEDDLDENEDE